MENLDQENLSGSTENKEKTFNESIFEMSQEAYLDLFERFENNITFKDLTIKEWALVLTIKELRPGFSLEDLEKYTLKVVNLTEIVSSNFALSQSNYFGLKRSSERAIQLARKSIMDEIELYNSTVPNPANKRRLPSNDNLETMAYNRTLELQQSLIIAEMFYSFWEIHYKKIQMLNNRMTSLSVMKNIEMKLDN